MTLSKLYKYISQILALIVNLPQQITLFIHDSLICFIFVLTFVNIVHIR